MNTLNSDFLSIFFHTDFTTIATANYSQNAYFQSFQPIHKEACINVTVRHYFICSKILIFDLHIHLESNLSQNVLYLSVYLQINFHGFI